MQRFIVSKIIKYMKQVLETDNTCLNQTNITTALKPSVFPTKTFRDPELSASDRIEIKRKLQECKKNIAKSLSDNEEVQQGILFLLISSMALIIFLIYMSRISVISELSNVVISLYEYQEWQSSPQKFLADVHSLDDLDSYIKSNLLTNTFSLPYLQSYNYICGMRFTLKLANMEKNPLAEYENAIKYVTEDQSYSGLLNNPGEETNNQAYWNYTYDSFRNLGGFTDYFINISYTEALIK